MTNKIKFFICVLLASTSVFAQDKIWTLQECVEYALDNNISIQQAQNTLLSNEQDILAAKGQFLPSLGGSLGQRMNIGSGFDQVTNQRVNNATTHSFNYNLGLSQTVFNGFRLLNSYKRAKLNYENNNLELNRIKDDISLNVVNAYLNVLFNKENLEVALAQYKFTQKQLEQVKSLVDAGVQPRANIYDVEATLANDMQSVTVAENNLTLAKLSLTQFLQIPYKGFDVEVIEVDSPSEALLYNSIDPVLNFAMENRNEIKVAQKNIEVAELGTEISKSGYYPSVSFSYGFGSVWSESKIDLFKQGFFSELDNNKGHNLGLSVNIPIFSQFSNKTSVAKSRIQEENSKLALDQAKLNLESTIQRAYTDAQAAFRSYQAAKASLESQQLAFDNAKERYNIGAMNNFDLEQSRIRLINAEAQLVRAKYDFVFKTKILDFYQGKSVY